jgi:hypothetical protein
MEEDTGGPGTFIYDACPTLNNFTRVGWTENVSAVWDYGQFLGYDGDDWLIMDNESALTTGSRSWRTIINFSWRYGTGVYSDNDTAYGKDWSNFMLFEDSESFFCYCRQADDGLRYVSAPVPIGEWIDVICSYDVDDDNRLTMYLNGTSIVSNTGAACDYPFTQGQVVIDSYPVVGVLPRLTATYDETFYRTASTNPLEAFCLWTHNNLDCSEPEPPQPEPNITIGGCCNAGGVYNIPVGEPTLQTCVYIGNETTSYIVNKTYITRTCCGDLENLSCCPCEHSILESCLYGCENGLGCKDAAFLPGANNREKTEALAWGIFLLMMIAAYLMTTVNSWTQKALMFLITLLAAIFVTAIFPFPLTLIGVTAILLSVVYMISLVEGARRNE